MSIDLAGIVGEHGRMVFQAAFRVLGNAADAEDVAQDVFTEIASHAPISEVRSWGAYLRRLAVFRAIDRRRKRRNESPPIEWDAVPSAGLSPHDEAVQRELAEQLRNLIASLPDREGAVFVLRYLERMSNVQIAEVLGISTGAVAAAVHKARAKIDACVAQTTPGELP